MKEGKFIPVKEGCDRYGFTYSSSKKVMTINSRDFYEKGFCFIHENRLYRYTCSVADSESIIPVPKETTRGDTFYNVSCIYRDENDGNKVKLVSVIQCDWKLKLPQFVYSSVLPKGAKSWHENVQKFYMKNYKKL